MSSGILRAGAGKRRSSSARSSLLYCVHNADRYPRFEPCRLIPPLWPDALFGPKPPRRARLSLGAGGKGRAAAFGFLPMRLDQLALAVVDAVLDDLRRPAVEILLARLELAVDQFAVAHLDAVEARDFGVGFKREAAFDGLERAERLRAVDRRRLGMRCCRSLRRSGSPPSKRRRPSTSAFPQGRPPPARRRSWQGCIPARGWPRPLPVL